MNKLVKIVRVDAKGNGYDVAGNRYAKGGDHNTLTEGCYITYRESTVTSRTDNTTGNLVDLEPDQYWVVRIASAVFTDKQSALEATSESALLELEASMLVAGQKAAFAKTYNVDLASALN